MARPRKPRWPALPRRKPGTGSLQRLTDGTLRARLPARVDPKRTAREFPADALDDALAWLDGHLTGKQHTGAITLDDWGGIWWMRYVEPIRSPTTASLYLIALKDLAPIGGKSIDELRPGDFQTVVAGLSKRLAPSTLAVRISIWRSCLERSVDDELIARNPVRNLDVARPIKNAQQRRGWTVAEVRALWAAIRGHRFEAAYALVIGCGLRIGEVLGVAWEHVDIERRRLWVGPQFTGGRWRTAPKGHNPHWIDIPAPVLLVLIRHRDSQPPGMRLVFQSPHPRTVRTAAGRARLAANAAAGRTEAPWSYTTVRADFLDLAEQIGLGDRRQHAGRHGLASHLLEEGIPPAVVAAVLGHADAGVTLGVYAHASQEGHERARAAVDRLLGDGVFGEKPEA